MSESSTIQVSETVDWPSHAEQTRGFIETMDCLPVSSSLRAAWNYGNQTGRYRLEVVRVLVENALFSPANC